SVVKTLGTGQYAHALHAKGAGSLIEAVDSRISTQGQYSYGAYAQDGGQIVLDGGSITTASLGGYGLSADGANAAITARNLSITAGKNANAVYVGKGGTVTLENSTVKSDTAGSGAGLYASGAVSLISIRNTDVEVGTGIAA